MRLGAVMFLFVLGLTAYFVEAQRVEKIVEVIPEPYVRPIPQYVNVVPHSQPYYDETIISVESVTNLCEDMDNAQTWGEKIEVMKQNMDLIEELLDLLYRLLNDLSPLLDILSPVLSPLIDLLSQLLKALGL